jgi:hypothetical protein
MASGKSSGTLLLALACLGVSVSLARAQMRPPAPRVTPDTFHVALLLGTNTSGLPPAGLPAAAEKALREASEVLAFKRFEVEDQVVLRGVWEPEVTEVKGPRGRRYRLELAFAPPETSSPNDIPFTVVLSEASGAEDAAGRTELVRTTVTARVGETVVVGTSRPVTKAVEQALLLLITPLTPAIAEPFLASTVTRTSDFLARTLAGDCGTATVYGESGWATQWKLSKFVVRDFVLSMDRITVMRQPGLNEGQPQSYRVRLADVLPNAFVPRRLSNPIVQFVCRDSECVTSEWGGERAFYLYVCEEKLEDVIRGMQLLIGAAQAAQGTPSPSRRGGLGTSMPAPDIPRTVEPGPALRPTVPQATDTLRTVLTSECGTGTLFHDWPWGENWDVNWAVVTKTRDLAVRDGVLSFERVPVSNVLEQNPAVPGGAERRSGSSDRRSPCLIASERAAGRN